MKTNKNTPITGQVFLMEQRAPQNGNKIVAIFGIIQVPEDLEVDKQFDMFGKPVGDRIDCSIRNPHEWKGEEDWRGMGITGMLTSAAWRI